MKDKNKTDKTEWFTSNYKKKEPKPVIEICRICDGECKGVETHEKTRKSWFNQSPVTVKGYEEYPRTSRNI